MLYCLFACNPDDKVPADSAPVAEESRPDSAADSAADSDADTDTDTDTDTDSDTDADTDSDADADPAWPGGTGPWVPVTEAGQLNGSDVTWYYPSGGAACPVMVWSHGFARSGSNHLPAAEQAASWGFVVAVPNLPSFSDHQANGEAIAMDFLEGTRQRYASMVSGQSVLVGHSAGGLATFVAAGLTPVDAVVGLDPVDNGGLGAAAAPLVTAPTLVLLGEDSLCNSWGSGSTMATQLGGSSWVVDVLGANHCDFESATDAICEFGCLASADASRQALIVDYTIAWALHYTVGGADEWVQGAQADADRSAGRISW